MCFVFILGYLAQTIGLCLVLGVNEWRHGKSEFMIAMLLSGAFSWVATLYALYIDVPTQFKSYKVDYWFALGGLLFGLGAAINSGCGISTLSRLTRGESKMIFSVVGWLIGWTIVAVWAPEMNHQILSIDKEAAVIPLIVISLFSVLWAIWGDKERKKLWSTMLLLGLISGFVFLYQPKWPPSSVLHQFSLSIVNSDMALLPSSDSFLLMIFLWLGMLAATWKTKTFKYKNSNWKFWLLHTTAGICMGIGASLALGGNGSQLLLALPAFSPAGFVAILFMVVGVRLGLSIRDKLTVRFQ